MVMAKEMTHKKNGAVHMADRNKSTKTVVARMLIMAALDIIAVCVLLSVRRDSMVELAFVLHWLTPLAIVFGVAGAGAIAWQVLTVVKKINTGNYLFTPAMAICVALFCLLACLLYKQVSGAFIAIASVAATVIFLVYCLYMHIFYR